MSASKTGEFHVDLTNSPPVEPPPSYSSAIGLQPYGCSFNPTTTTTTTNQGFEGVQNNTAYITHPHVELPQYYSSTNTPVFERDNVILTQTEEEDEDNCFTDCLVLCIQRIIFRSILAVIVTGVVVAVLSIFGLRK